MKQTGFIDFVISAVVLDGGMAKWKYTPARSLPLFNNEDGVPDSGIFNYRSVVGIMLCLSGHTRPDIAFAVNCFARYMFCTKHFHEDYLKQIGRYLKLARYHGLNLNTNRELFNIDSYLDTDLSGMYVH